VITAAQREARRKYAGSSDAAAICGLDPYRSAADVWLAKTGRADDFAGNEHTDRGNLLEPVVLTWARERIGRDFARDVMDVGACGLLAANFDGRSGGSVPEPFVVEAKTTVTDDEWGDEGTDQVPDRVVCQVHHQMTVAGPEFRVAFVPVLIPGFKAFDFRLYRVDRDDELADALAARCRAFMTDHVRADVRPADFKPSLDVLKRVRREPDKLLDGMLSADLVDAWEQAKLTLKQAKEEEEKVKAALIAALDVAEGALCPQGLITYLQTSRKGYVVEPTTYRTLRLKKARETK
jgi:putative phage-type endonuclease